MLEIVLLILKTAGIILVAVLGILITMLCSVLFVPVRYRGDFSVSDMEEGGKKAISVKLRAVWFLRLVRVHITCEEKFRVKVKVLFFTLMDTAKEKRKGRRRKGKRDGENHGEEKNGPERKEQTGGSEEEEAVAATEEKESETDRKRGTEARISNILQTIRNFCDKLKGIRKKAERVETLWESEQAVNSRSLVGRQLLYLLRYTRPKKLSGYLQFGFDDPSTTGYAMAVYGILYPVWSPELSLEPDFEKQVLRCHILVKGRIRAWHPAKAASAVFFSKDVRRVIKDIRDM